MQLTWRSLATLVVAVLVAVREAHAIPVPPPDGGSTRLRVLVKPHQLELRFDFDSPAAAKVKASDNRPLAAFVEDHLHLEINGIAMNPGVLRPTGDVRQILFVRDCAETVKTIGISMEFFEVLGDRHRVEAEFEQEGKKYRTAFTVFESDYLYDTGWDAPQLAWRLDWKRGIEDAWRSRWLLVLIFIATLVSRLMIRRGLWRMFLAGSLIAASLALWSFTRALPEGTAEPIAWRWGQIAGGMIAALVASPILFIPRRKS